MREWKDESVHVLWGCSFGWSNFNRCGRFAWIENAGCQGGGVDAAVGWGNKGVAGGDTANDLPTTHQQESDIAPRSVDLQFYYDAGSGQYFAEEQVSGLISPQRVGSLAVYKDGSGNRYQHHDSRAVLTKL